VDAERFAIWEIQAVNGLRPNIINRDFLVSKYAEISGAVWTDINANAEIDGGEPQRNDLSATLHYQSGPYAAWWETVPVSDRTVNVTGGRFTFGNLWPGTYTVTLNNPASGVPLSSYMRTNNSTNSVITEVSPWVWQVVVDSGVIINDANFGLVRPSTLTGDIWHDINNDGLKNNGELSIGVATLERVVSASDLIAFAPDSAIRAYHREIDVAQNNGFVFNDLFPGVYLLTSIIGGDFLRTYFNETLNIISGSGSATISSIPNNDKQFIITITDTTGNGLNVESVRIALEGDVTAGYALPSRIQGRVFNDALNEVVFNNHAAIAAASVSLYRVQGQSRIQVGTAQTGGNFNFGGLLPAVYEIEISFPSQPTGWIPTLPSGAQTVTSPNTAVFDATTNTWVITIPLDEANVTINTGFAQPSSISGFSWVDLNADGVRNLTPSAEPLFANLTVTLYRNYSDNGTTGEVVATSSPINDGAFSFTNLLPDVYTLVLTRPDNALRPWVVTNISNDSTIIGNIVVAANTNITNQNFGLTQKSIIQGRVFNDENTQTLNGITATLYYMENGVATGIAATSSPNGTFDFAGLMPGQYQLSFSGMATGWHFLPCGQVNAATGDSSAVFDETSGVWVVTVVSNSPFIDLQTPMHRQTGISGVVWHDTNADGIRDAMTEPLFNGATVALFQNWTGTTDTQIGSNVITGADGAFNFQNLAPGEYTVVITPPTGYFVTNTGQITDNITLRPMWQTVTIGYNNLDETVDFGLVQTFSIAGRAWRGNSPSNVFEPSTDTPKANARIELSGGPDSISIHTQTDANGLYSFTGLLAGTYTVTFAQTGFENYIIINEFTAASGTNPNWAVSLNPAARSWSVERNVHYSQTDINFALMPFIGIAGIVWHDLDASGTIDVGEEGLENREVRIFEIVNGSDVHVATLNTNATGEFSFVANPGQYRVVVVPPAASGWGISNRPQPEAVVDVSLDSGVLVDFGLFQFISISGTVWSETDADGVFTQGGTGEVPLGGHGITVTRNGAAVPATVEAEADGTFLLTDQWPGNYVVVFDDKAGHLVTNSGANFDPVLRKWEITAVSADTISGINCAFTPQRIITAAVWYDTNENGVWDDGEAAMPQIQLLLERRQNGSFVPVSKYPAAVTLNSGGDFTFEGLMPGEYRVTALNTDAYFRTNPETGQNINSKYVDFAFDANDTVFTQNKQIGLARPAVISGMAFHDVSNTGVFDPITDGAKIVTINIQRILPAPLIFEEITTQADGTFSVSVLPGEYIIDFGEVAGFVVTSAQTAEFNPVARRWNITVSSNQTKDDLFVGYRIGSVALTVTVNKDLSVMQSGYVRLYDTTGVFVTKAPITNNNGAINALFPAVLPGNYFVTVEGTQGQTPVLVPDTDKHITLQYWTVTFNPTSGSFESGTNNLQNGNVVLTVLNGLTVAAPSPNPVPEANHRFIAWYQDLANLIRWDFYTRTITQTTTITARWLLPEAFNITGRVTNENGDGVADVTVWIMQGNRQIHIPVVTDLNGDYTFYAVPEGIYNIVVQGNSGQHENQIRTVNISVFGNVIQNGTPVRTTGVFLVEPIVLEGLKNSVVMVFGDYTGSLLGQDIVVGGLSNVLPWFTANGGTTGITGEGVPQKWLENVVTQDSALEIVLYAKEFFDDTVVKDIARTMLDDYAENHAFENVLYLNLWINSYFWENKLDYFAALTVIDNPPCYGGTKYHLFAGDKESQPIIRLPFPIEVRIPLVNSDLSGETGLAVFRKHTFLNGSTRLERFVPSSGATEGFFHDKERDEMVIFVQYFSEFAIARSINTESESVTGPPLAPPVTATPAPSHTMDISIVLAQGQAFAVNPGSTINYTITVTNTGNSPLTNIAVTCLVLGTTFNVGKIQNIAPGQNYTMDFSFNTPADIAPSSLITATATATQIFAQTVHDTANAQVSMFMEQHLWYLRGYPDNTMRPDATITRAEVSMVLYRMLLPSLRLNYAAADPFSDVDRNQWYGAAIATLSSLGIITGYEDGTFRPNNPITRAEMSTILSRFFVIEPANGMPFTDVDQNHWAARYILSALANGWLEGYPDGTFRPDSQTTRAEFATMFNRVLNRLVSLENILPGVHIFDDLTPAHWGYTALVEAANSHTYTRSPGEETETWIILTGDGIDAAFNE
jgi:uncharacterized repeat protein (TIGR01451 family)